MIDKRYSFEHEKEEDKIVLIFSIPKGYNLSCQKSNNGTKNSNNNTKTSVDISLEQYN